jgi:hypothetical protein
MRGGLRCYTGVSYTGVSSGWVTLGGRRVPVIRARVRAADGSRELPVASTATR